MLVRLIVRSIDCHVQQLWNQIIYQELSDPYKQSTAIMTYECTITIDDAVSYRRETIHNDDQF